MQMRRRFRQCQRTCSSRAASSIGVRPASSLRTVEDHPRQEAEAEASAWIGALILLGEGNGLLAISLRCPRRTTRCDP